MLKDSQDGGGTRARADEIQRLTVDIVVASAEVRVTAGSRRGREAWIIDPRLALADLRVRARGIEGAAPADAPPGADEAPLPEVAGDR